MRQVARKSLVTAVAAGGVLAAGAGYAHADAGADSVTIGSPGVVSGNNVQAPVHVPVNICGNTLNVVGVLNPALGNQCANVSDGEGTGTGGSGSGAKGDAQGSPGVVSGNNVQVPVDIPVNTCGNAVTVVGGANTAGAADCQNGSVPVHNRTPAKPRTPHRPHHPGTAVKAAHRNLSPQHAAHSELGGELAHTGSSAPLQLIIPAGSGLLLGGVALYRRFQPAGR